MTATIYPTSSYAMIVRDAIMSRVKNMPLMSGWFFSTNKGEQIQLEQIPFFGIYFINEDLIPEGDADTGEPRFHSMVLYGFSIIVQNNDMAAAEDKLDEIYTKILDRLLTDPSLYLNPAAQIQSYIRGNRSHQFGAVGADNATPVAECRFTLTCDLGTIDFPPVVPDMLERVHLETRYPPGSDPAEVQQVYADYDIETTKETKDESSAKRRQRPKTSEAPSRKGVQGGRSG